MPEEADKGCEAAEVQEKPKITHCLFDMDGLLLDTETYYSKAFSNVCKRFGKDFTWEDKLKIMGRTGIDVARMFVQSMQLPLQAEEFLSLLDAECDSIFSQPIPALPGALRLVNHLHKHDIPLALATSSKRLNFERKSMHHPELFSRFSHFVISADDPEVSAGKPDPQVFLVAASRFAYPPKDMSHCLVFEDSVAGVQSGNSAGAHTIWVPDSKMDRSLASPHLTLDSLEHFKPEEFGLPPFCE